MALDAILAARVASSDLSYLKRLAIKQGVSMGCVLRQILADARDLEVANDVIDNFNRGTENNK